MRNFMLVAVSTALLAATPLAVSAQSSQPMGPPGDRHPAPSSNSPMGSMGSSNMDHQDHSQDRGMGHDMGHDMDRGDHMGRGDYGRWDDHWGSRPPHPPKSYSRHGNWYQHVRACQTRYRSYNSRTDTYVVRRGVVARCRL
ncbi:BA14K family protein [Caulobacter sp. DWR3-1-2]|uniref:BA14K family protein n=1 Tax=Caulobacter sp. DWR3-1-2 TaxID=2804647 RepID=UPI003CFB4995